MTGLYPISMSYEDSVSSCWKDSKIEEKYKRNTLMMAIYTHSPLLSLLIQKANLEEFVQNLRGTAFCPSISYSIEYQKYFENISYEQARLIVLSSLSECIITKQDIEDQVRIPSCLDGFYIHTGYSEEKKVYTIQNNIEIIKMDKKIIDDDGNIIGQIYICNGCLDYF